MNIWFLHAILVLSSHTDQLLPYVLKFPKPAQSYAFRSCLKAPAYSLKDIPYQGISYSRYLLFLFKAVLIVMMTLLREKEKTCWMFNSWSLNHLRFYALLNKFIGLLVFLIKILLCIHQYLFYQINHILV